MAVTKSDAKNAYTALQAYISENPAEATTSCQSTGPGPLGTPYGSARVSKDVTVAIAGQTGVGYRNHGG